MPARRAGKNASLYIKESGINEYAYSCHDKNMIQSGEFTLVNASFQS